MLHFKVEFAFSESRGICGLAQRMVFVQDNLDTHAPGSLYEEFPPAKPARVKPRLEFHFTPKQRVG